MSNDKLYSITISTDAIIGSIINELLPSIDLYPSSYFDSDDNIARLNLYYEEETECEERFIQIRTALNDWVSLVDIDLSAVELVKGDLVKEDWSEKWKEFFHVEKISERLVIKPSWEDYTPEGNDVVIEIDPGMSFGTGNHGTTKGCLQLLDRLSIDIKDSFLDMGCGSGILSMAASKLGIQEIDGFDYDEDSVRIANENLVLSKCGNVKLTLQNLYDLEISKRYTLVIANILAPVLMENVKKIVSALKSGEKSRLVLSGILHEQFSDILQTFEPEGLELVEHIKIDKWSTGLFKLKKP